MIDFARKITPAAVAIVFAALLTFPNALSPDARALAAAGALIVGVWLTTRNFGARIGG